MKLFKTPLRMAALAMGSLAISLSSASAQVINFTAGDLILAFQASGGQGSSVNYFYNLGAATSLRDNGNQGILGYIGTDLENIYGADWYSRTDLFYGVIGVRSSDAQSGLGATGITVDGDPSRTVYASKPTTTPGASLPWQDGAVNYSSSTLGIGANSIESMQNVVDTLTATGNSLDADGVTANNNGASLSSSDAVKWANSWTAYNSTTGGAAFSIFAGGLQGTFGGEGDAAYADVYRILAYTGATQAPDPTGTRGLGSYETTIAIGSDGSISAVPEPSTYVLITLAVGAAVIFRRRLSGRSLVPSTL